MLFRYKIFVVLLFVPVFLCAEEGMDGKIRQYRDVMWLENSWAGSVNPVSMAKVPLESLFGLRVEYDLSDGNFRQVDEAEKENDLQVSIFGIKKLNKMVFEGNMGYYNQVQYDRKWNSTLFISPQNPFILADSIAGKFNLEKFVLHGGFSWNLSSRVSVGLRADYEAGSAADQTDPRPDTKSMRFGLTPGVAFRLSEQFSLGISAKIGLLSESVKYSSVVGGVNHMFFLFNGLGNFYPNAGTAYERKYKGQTYTGDIQLGWQGRNGLSNFFEGGMECAYEDATDGGAQRKFKGGKYKSKQYHFIDRFQIRRKQWSHNVMLGMKVQQIDGIWYEQRDVIDENGSTYWEVVSSSVKHKEDRVSASLGYRLDFLKEELPDWTLEIKGVYLHAETKNYPELQQQTYSLLTGNARLTKHLNWRGTLFGLFAEGGIQHAVDETLVADGLKLVTVYTRPAFGYLSADSWQAGGGMNVKFPLQMKDFRAYLGAFAKYTARQYAGEDIIYKNTNRNQIDFGVDFTF